MKVWNKQVFGNAESRIESLKSEVNRLDLKGELEPLTDDEVMERKKIIGDLWQAYKSKESILFQKARFKWLKEGDTNSRFFHKCINSRRRSNEIIGLWIDNRWEEKAVIVKEKIRNHFHNIFNEEHWERPILDIHFNQLDYAENLFLTAPFTEEEIKAAV